MNAKTSRAVGLIGILGAVGAVAAAEKPSSRPDTAVVTTRPATQASTKPSAVVRPSPELLAMWKTLDARREEAVLVARGVENGERMELAKKNRLELIELTAKFNELLAPVAAASPLRYGPVQPKQGIMKGIWLYKAGRQVEAYNAGKKGEMSEDEYGVFVALNQYREALGLLPLEYDLRLRDAARGHSRWMNETGTFEHVSDKPGEKTPDQRVKRQGYDWRSVAENIAMGQVTADEVFMGWFESPKHHHNLVAENVHMGVGKEGKYWTQNFCLGEIAKAMANR